MRPVFFILACGLLAFPASAAAETLQCACQQVIVCGADQCDMAPIEICPSTDIRLTLETPAIQVCSFTDCLEGSARRTDVSEAVIALDGAYSPRHTPEANATQVTALIDVRTGIGTVQSSDEEGVAQYSVICQSAQ